MISRKKVEFLMSLGRCSKLEILLLLLLLLTVVRDLSVSINIGCVHIL